MSSMNVADLQISKANSYYSCMIVQNIKAAGWILFCSQLFLFRKFKVTHTGVLATAIGRNYRLKPSSIGEQTTATGIFEVAEFKMRVEGYNYKQNL